jgi:Predicted alternative tryptophan synthase beta-subunit (paralog of TrpB)
LCSQLLKDGLIEAKALQQLECFEAGIQFAKAEGIIPAPEANHAVAQAIREAKLCKESGESKTILFNLCGHGHLDLQAYNDYFDGKLQDHYLTEEELKGSLKELADYPPVA